MLDNRLRHVDEAPVKLAIASVTLTKHFVKLAIGSVILTKYFVKLAIRSVTLTKHFVKLAIGSVTLTKHFVKLVIGSVLLTKVLVAGPGAGGCEVSRALGRKGDPLALAAVLASLAGVVVWRRRRG